MLVSLCEPFALRVSHFMDLTISICKSYFLVKHHNRSARAESAFFFFFYLSLKQARNRRLCANARITYWIPHHGGCVLRSQLKRGG